MKRLFAIIMILSCMLMFGGCAQKDADPAPLPESTGDRPSSDTSDAAQENTKPTPAPAPVRKRDAIPFKEGQLYAAAYLGYQTIDDWNYYTEKYLDTAEIPTHYVSGGDYYLVIPRYDGMALSLFVNDIETSEAAIRFRDPDTGAFVIQCNVSDIFADVTIRLEYKGETAEFSPFISLKDGSVMVGERGLDITKTE